jgi:hypothetical protein
LVGAIGLQDYRIRDYRATRHHTEERAMIGDAEQYQELVALYGTYGDEELKVLGRDMSDLTATAQEVLQGEIRRRGLKITPAGVPVEDRVLTDEDLLDMRAYAELAPAECIFGFEDERAASAAYYALTGEGIEAIVVSAESRRFDDRGPRVVVTPKDAERAAAILSQPSTDELRAEKEEAPAEFDLPCCPACGGEETLLESVDPVNQWRCDDCGKVWVEDAASTVE